MKIAVISCVWPPYGGGVGVVALSQAKELARLGHQVTAFTPAYHGEKVGTRLVAGVTIKFLRPIMFFGNAAILPQLLWQIKNFDIIHLHLYFIGSTWFIKLVSFFRDIPYVLQYHNDLGGKGMRGKVFRCYTKFFLSNMVERSQFIFGLSPEHAIGSDLNNLTEVVKRKILYLANGVDVNNFFPKVVPLEIHTRLRIPENVKVLLFVSTLDYSHFFKGLGVLLESLALLKKQGESFYLLIVGEGNQKKYYQEKVTMLGISEWVTFVGFVGQNDLPSYYNLCDVVVVPSVSVESFSLVALEAMACAKPVIVSALPGPAALVKGVGILVAPGDVTDLACGIKKLIQNHELRFTLGQMAHARVIKN